MPVGAYERRRHIPLNYGEERYEWVEGYVIWMGRSTVIHMMLLSYFEFLFRAYLHWNPIGKIFRDAITVRQLNTTRMPGFFFVRTTNSGILTATEFEKPSEKFPFRVFRLKSK